MDTKEDKCKKEADLLRKADKRISKIESQLEELEQRMWWYPKNNIRIIYNMFKGQVLNAVTIPNWMKQYQLFEHAELFHNYVP